MSSRLTIVSALLVLVTVSAVAQTTEILATGPDRGRGVPYLQPNVIPYYAVTYRSSPPEGGASTASRAAPTGPAGIRVLFAATEVVAYSAWKPAPCAGLRTLRVRESPPVLYYKSSQGWSLFFAFPSSTKTACSFVSTFIERFNYFLGITQNSAISSFPAVLRLP